MPKRESSAKYMKSGETDLDDCDESDEEYVYHPPYWMNLWKEENKKFVSTKASKLVETKLHHERILILGDTGCGKSAIAHNIALKYAKNDWQIVNVRSRLRDVRTAPVKRSPVLFIIDDPIGKDVLDEKSCRNWNLQQQLLDCYFRESKKMDTKVKTPKVIVTCRSKLVENELNFHKSKFAIINLDDDEAKLTKEEKEDILKKHLDYSELENSDVNQILNVEESFPLISQIVSSTKSFQENVQAFYKEPFELIKQQVLWLKENSIEKYLCLLLLILNGNKLSKVMFATEGEDSDGMDHEEDDESNYMSNNDDDDDDDDDDETRSDDKGNDNDKDCEENAGDDIDDDASREDSDVDDDGNDKDDNVDCENKDIIDEKLLNVLIKKFNLSNSVNGAMLFQSLISLDGHYFVKRTGKEGKVFLITNYTFLQTLTHIFCTEIPDLFIKHCQGSFFRIFTTSLCTQKKPFADVQLQDSFIDAFVGRIEKDIKSGAYLDVFLSPWMRDERVLTKFKLHLKEKPNEELKKLILHSKLKQDVDLQNLPSNKWTTWRGFSRLDLISHSNEVSPIILSLILNIDELFSAMISLVKNNLATSDFDKSLLFSACCVNGQKDFARLAMEISSDKNACWSKEENIYAVHIAANFLQSDILSLILDAECDVNIVTRYNESPLFLAVAVDKYTHQNIPWACDKEFSDPNKTLEEVLEERCMETLTLLVQKGADVNIHPTKLPSALAVSCHKGNKEIVQFLLRSGASVNETGNDKLSALHLASKKGNLEIVRLLLEKGADVQMRSKYGFTPLYLAARKGHSAIVEILLTRETSEELKERTAYNPFFAACAHGHMNIVQMFLQHKPYINCSMTNDTSAILAAVGNGHAKVVDLLLTTGADVNSFQNKKLMSPILFDVIAHGYELVLKLLVTCGVNLSMVTRETENSDTPLIIASQNGHYPTVQFLLENGANVNDTNRLKISPLYLAAENGHLEIVQLLLKNNAGVNLCSKRDSSPLIRASYRGHNNIVKELLNQGADVNLVNRKVATPLFLASKYGHAQAAQTLLAHKADVNLCTKSGCSPLFVAARFGHREVVKDLLCHGAKINENDSKNPLLNSAFHGYYKITEMLIDNGAKINVQDKEGSTPLINAAMEGWTGIVKLLLKRGADVNKCDKDGESALHWASLMGYSDIVKLLIEHGMDINSNDEDTYSPYEKALGGNRLSTALLLLEHGADVNAIACGTTALYLACKGGFKDVVDDLLARDANVNPKEEDGSIGDSPLYAAVLGGHTEIAEELLRRGADVNYIPRYKDKTLLMTATAKDYSRIVQLLMDHGANVNAKDKSGNTALHASAYDGFKLESMLNLLKNKADVNAQNKNGASPIMMALNRKTLTKECVQTLIDFGADVNMCDNFGESVLHLAALCFGRHEVVSLLLDHGADVNAQNEEGETALHEACYPGHLKNIAVLLQHGAGVFLRSNYNMTALEIADEEEHPKVARFLFKKINEKYGVSRVEEASPSKSGISNVSDSVNIVVRTRTNPLGSVLPMRKIVKLKKTWRI